MKQNFILDKSTLKWWGIFALCLFALSLFVILEYQNALQISTSAKLNPQTLGAIITKSAIGLILMILVLALAWKQETPLSSTKNGHAQHHTWLKETLPFGVAIWSDEGKLIHCNSLYQSKLNLTPKEAEFGNSYVKIMNKIKAKNSYKIISDEETLRQFELSHIDGTTSLIDERPLSNGGFITMIFDISEKVKAQTNLKKMQDEQRQLTKEIQTQKIKAEAASRSKTAFLAHLSHDVRTPLNHIIGFSDLISHEAFGPIGDNRYLKYINDIKSSGEKLLSSFSEILELAQLEGGDLILRPEKIELAKTMQATTNRFQANAKRAGIKIEINAPDDTIIYTDKMCLERMIYNIVENSIRFTRKGGVIKINAWLADDGVVFEISDNGIGMSPERLKDLTQPFVLGDAAFTREGGVGLGIAISRAIAELNGGNLSIDSNLSMGTTVAISIPTKISLKTKQIGAA